MNLKEAIREARREFGDEILFNGGAFTWDYDNLIEEISLYDYPGDYYLLGSSIVVVDSNGFLGNTVYVIEEI